MKDQNKRTEMNSQVSIKTERSAETLDYVTVRGLEYDKKSKNLIVYLPGNKRGILPYKEASIFRYKFSKNQVSNMPIQIGQLLNHNVKAKVIGNSDDGSIIVSRRAVQKEFLNNLFIGKIIEAKIYNIADFGLFVNLGEDVIALLPVINISRARTFKLAKWFSVGDKIKVTVTEIDLEPELRITVSRKELYSRIYDKGGIVEVKICAKHDKTSYFVEIDPGSTGIMDIDDLPIPEFEEGTKVMARIRSRKPDGHYKLNLLPI